jgi:hypothetical protein
MHGEEAPAGTGTLKIWFVPGPNRSGGLSLSATPEALGPRNCGQAVPPIAAAEPSNAQAPINANPRLINAAEIIHPHGNVEISKFHPPG